MGLAPLRHAHNRSGAPQRVGNTTARLVASRSYPRRNDPGPEQSMGSLPPVGA